MAIQRLTLSDLETTILQIFGYADSTHAPWKTSATLYKRINDYIQRLTIHIEAVAQPLRQLGYVIPNPVRFDMWRTAGTLTCTSGSSTAYLPADFDTAISFWDNTNARAVYPIQDSDSEYEKIRVQNAGPPERIEILGFELNGATWQRKCTLWPPTVTGTTPSIAVKHWRIPAMMSGGLPTLEYPDLDPRYQAIAYVGPVVDLARPASPEFDRYSAMEKELLTELCLTARGI